MYSNSQLVFNIADNDKTLTFLPESPCLLLSEASQLDMSFKPLSLVLPRENQQNKTMTEMLFI